jgi:hypothetical protein
MLTPNVAPGADDSAHDAGYGVKPVPYLQAILTVVPEGQLE